MKSLNLVAVTALVIFSLFLVGCGVSVESEPIEAHAEERGCATTFECSNRQVELLEDIRRELHSIRENQYP